MFAVVRTGGKQYRVAIGDKIAVERLAGEAGETIELADVLLAGEGGALADVSGVSVSAEIIAQAKGEKVVVFKKRRRHNYRRKAGHRQQLTLLRILSVGEKGKPTAATADKESAKDAVVDDAPSTEAATTQPAAKQSDDNRSAKNQSAKPEASDTAGGAPKPSAPAKGGDVFREETATKAKPVKDAPARKSAAKFAEKLGDQPSTDDKKPQE